jgi:hypothetical protein
LFSRLSPFHWLSIILIATALQWCGGAYIGLSTDDYHYLQELAPIDDISDIPGAFAKPDANPQYWRPVSNATLTADFLLYGNNGGGYHITNLLLHLIATTLVFVACRRLFAVDLSATVLASALFGLTAGHDSNLLWIAARGDILATIFSLSTLLLLRSEKLGIKALSLISYFLALCSKELALMVIPVAVIFELIRADATRKQKLKQVGVVLVGLLLVTTIYIVLRSQFTVPASEAQPMLGEGMHSPLVAIKNVIYGIGYLLVPLDISSAVTILTTYRMQALAVAALILVLLFALARRSLRTLKWRMVILPAIFSIFFAVTVAQSFERWRLYAPSIGLFAIIAIVAVNLWRNGGKYLRLSLSVLAVAFLCFHVYRAAVEKHSWHLASEVLASVKEDYKALIAEHGETPLFLITQPSKIGGGSIMKVSSSRIVLQAKAELLMPNAVKRASAGGLSVDHNSGLLVAALDPDEGFTHVSVTQVAPNIFKITVPRESSTRLQPETLATGSTAREKALHDGDTLHTPAGKVIVHHADRTYATDVTLVTELTNRIPVYFDGKHVRNLP